MTTCSFAYPNTYGHECDKPAMFVGVFKSDRTTTGIWYGRRCEKHRHETGGENRGVCRWESFDPSKHVNQYR